MKSMFLILALFVLFSAENIDCGAIKFKNSSLNLNGLSDLMVDLRLNISLAESIVKTESVFKEELINLLTQLNYIMMVLNSSQVLILFCENSNHKIELNRMLLNKYQRDIVYPWAERINLKRLIEYPESAPIIGTFSMPVSNASQMIKQLQKNPALMNFFIKSYNEGLPIFEYDCFAQVSVINNKITTLALAKVKQLVFEAAEKQTGLKVENITNFEQSFSVSEDINLNFKVYEDAATVYIDLFRLKFNLRDHSNYLSSS